MISEVKSEQMKTRDYASSGKTEQELRWLGCSKIVNGIVFLACLKVVERFGI